MRASQSSVDSCVSLMQNNLALLEQVSGFIAATDAQKAAQASQQLLAMARHMDELVGRFRVDAQ